MPKRAIWASNARRAESSLPLSCISSTYPDAIQKLSQAKTFVDMPLAGYEAAFLGSAWLGKAVAGLTGLAVIFGACTLCGRLLSRQRGA